jgi:hypothetical protein
MKCTNASRNAENTGSTSAGGLLSWQTPSRRRPLPCVCGERLHLAIGHPDRTLGIAGRRQDLVSVAFLRLNNFVRSFRLPGRPGTFILRGEASDRTVVSKGVPAPAGTALLFVTA